MLETKQAPPLPRGHAERQEAEAAVGQRQARASTAELSQLSFLEEVENCFCPPASAGRPV